MTIQEYLQSVTGKGILSTADSSGKVNAAIYAKPQVMENGQLAFIMRERLTYHNLQANPFANYLFIEDGDGYKGVRLFLEKVGEDTNPELIAQMTKRNLPPEVDQAKGKKYLLFFSLEKILPLIGDKETGVEL